MADLHRFSVGENVVVKSKRDIFMQHEGVIDIIFKNGNMLVRIPKIEMSMIFLPDGSGKIDEETGKQNPWYVEHVGETK